MHLTPVNVAVLLLAAVLIGASYVRGMVLKFRAGRSLTMRQRQLIDETAPKKNHFSILGWVFFIALAIGVFVVLRNEPAGSRPRTRNGDEDPWPSLISVAYLVVGWFALSLGYVVLKYDRHVACASKLAKAQRLDEAVAYLRSIIETKHPTRARLSMLGRLLLERGKPQEALQQFDHVIEKYGRSPPLVHNRALALAKLGRHEEAAAQWNAIVTPFSSGIPMLCHYAITLAELNRRSEGYAYLNRAELLCARASNAVDLDSKNAIELARCKYPQSEGFPVQIASGRS